MGPHMRGPHAALIRQGVTTLCAERYRDRKLRNKNKWFKDREGYEHPREIREFPPPNESYDEWNMYVDFILDDNNKRRSTANSQNISNQKYPSVHGTRSYAAIRHGLVSNYLFTCLILTNYKLF